VDDIAVAPGLLAADEARWSAIRDGSVLNAFEEDFEALPVGRLEANGAWRLVSGPVAALASPAAAVLEHDIPAPVPEGSAFDGGQGSAPGQFDQPVGIAIGPRRRLYVGDRNNHRVQVFDRDGDSVRAWGHHGSTPGEFREPHDVAADDEFI